MPITYTPAIKGTAIDSAIKGKTSGMTGKSSKPAGRIMWETVFDLIYTDFDTVLAKAVHAYLNTGLVTFPPIPVPLTAFPVVFSFKSLAKKSAKIVDSTVKTKTSGMVGKSSKPAGKIMWEEFCTQLGKDIYNEYPKKVIQALDHCIPIVPSGVFSPPNVGNLSPLPPVYDGLKVNGLSSNLNTFFNTKIKKSGTNINSTVKAQCTGLVGNTGFKAGKITWDIVIEIMTPLIAAELTKATSLFLTTSVGAWKNPAGPGLPITMAGPTPGSANLPATIAIS